MTAPATVSRNGRLLGRLGLGPVSLRRIGVLGRAEMILLLRNKTAATTALLLPLATVALFSTFLSGDGHVSTGALLATTMFGFVLLYVVYYNLVTTYVARREERVLKRLRTGVVTDAEILVGAAVPALALALAQVVLTVVAALVLFDLPMPVNIPLLLAAVLAGCAIFVLLATASSGFTRTVESAQITTLPVLILSMIGSGVTGSVESLPDALARVFQLLPLTPVLDLVRLGWLGTAGTDAPRDFVGVLSEAREPAVIILLWLAIGVSATRRWFRWDPRH
ncbi:ABC transporter permease [Plantactinospora endophytica]|uniref:Transport permease protein n=1 Tax=Plantactinospora endophytica TaxID=673535 RepID=A0ABQ4EA66_9ACTN|nr:ABC transporter permease [Plantactinospora endophytica]GIG91156.1 transport permease protein [Plantactinospora endophytica]